MDRTNGALNRKLRMGLIGGGQGAFIGRVHATAAILDNRADLVAGALSSDPEKARASAPRPAVTANAPIQSSTPELRGATKSDRQRFGVPSPSTACWRSIGKRVSSLLRLSSV